MGFQIIWLIWLIHVWIKWCSILNEDFYLQFNIILKDTDELIYSSGLVEYGGYINTIELNKELQKGEYDAIVFIQPYDMAMNKTNSAQLSVKIKLWRKC